MVVIRARLEPEWGAVVKQALEAARELVYRRKRAEKRGGVIETLADGFEDAPTVERQHADALVMLAESALHHGINPGAPGERYQVIVHVDAEVLAKADAVGQSVIEDGSGVAAETSQRLACDASRVVMRRDSDGRITDVGARTRTIPPSLRRALQHRDRGCRFPGCWVPLGHGHHINTGRKADPRRFRIWCCCVGGTIARFTRRDIRSSDGATASSDSVGRTVKWCPKRLRRRGSPPIQWACCDKRTKPRAWRFTRGRRCRDGPASR
jgi:Domain of unknown function (DUF222)